MAGRLLATVVFAACAGLVFWQALVHTVHRGTVAVPDLLGATVDHAEGLAHDTGLLVAVDQQAVFSATTPAGAIAEQEPLPGFHVKTGSTVTVRLSLGTEWITVPELRGESLQGGIRALERAGLTPGGRAQVDGHSLADRVLATSPPIAANVAPASPVSLLVNVAPARELWVMPSLLSRSESTVRRFCQDHQLRLGQVHEVDYPGVPGQVVLRQYPAAGSPLARTDIITIWVSR